MSNNQSPLLLLFVIFAFCLSNSSVFGFGAGNIPSFAYLEGRAFRHGDIEDTLADLIKKGASAGSGFALASLIGSKGTKFNGLDIKRVYFGNWLRDYSQAVDIASLQKVPLQTILNLCMVLGFMANGYATNEFQVTAERLGVYLPTEHIDNPKGYGNGEDARRYHPQLRGPVDPRELEIDSRTGMKNYIANETGHWDTSKALVRRTLEHCIDLGRRHRAGHGDKYVEYEAYRLLGQALHTLEDFPAHSNFCELVLISMGHNGVFPHVGDSVRVHAPNGKSVAPLVTGTFGANDFYHSLLGEATDHVSQASVSDLNEQLNKARAQGSRGFGDGGSDPSAALRGLLNTIPGLDFSDLTREMETIDHIRANAGMNSGGVTRRGTLPPGGMGGNIPGVPNVPQKRPDDMTPQELGSVIWQVLLFRDSVVKKITKTIDKIPGLGALLEKITETISVFIFTTLEPYIKPIMKNVTDGLTLVSGEVIDTHDQYEVFNDPRASDPTHSFLSKDHFNLILNEPAGHIAKAIVSYAVTAITKAWEDQSINARHLVDDILGCLFHPDFHDSNSKIQRDMLQCVKTWFQGLGSNQNTIIQRLSKQAVRNHQNIRIGAQGGTGHGHDSSQAQQLQQNLQGYVNQASGGQAQPFFSALGGGAGQGRNVGSGFPGGPGPGIMAPPLQTSFSGGPVPGGAASSFHAGDHGGHSHSHPSGTTSYPASPTTHHPHQQHQSFAPPSGPPPSFGGPQPPHHAGYAPSYAPSGPGGPGGGPGGFPSAPGGPGGFSGFPGAGGPGGYAPPTGPPPGHHGHGHGAPGGFPGAGFHPPAGPPPGQGGFGFPGAGGPPGGPGGPGQTQFPGGGSGVGGPGGFNFGGGSSGWS
ncbi:Het-C-domain-containing protein [Pluteus cervinus]|uniref:Het-C-domain-containing protein n=1 Tax=Pluteus cervinus TaxID=181527 RepID=A0ACD3B2L2_9AGAR|nr:Het-C-domain-containing protein [Pluteus cervinus]